MRKLIITVLAVIGLMTLPVLLAPAGATDDCQFMSSSHDNGVVGDCPGDDTVPDDTVPTTDDTVPVETDPPTTTVVAPTTTAPTATTTTPTTTVVVVGTAPVPTTAAPVASVAPQAVLAGELPRTGTALSAAVWGGLCVLLGLGVLLSARRKSA